jgi:hypothetical protein
LRLWKGLFQDPTPHFIKSFQKMKPKPRALTRANRVLAQLKDCPPELLGAGDGSDGAAKNYKIVYTSRREVYEVIEKLKKIKTLNPQ